MKLVPRPPGMVEAKTYWCTKCNRFGLGVRGRIPSCPVHGQTMVGSPADSRRVEPDAPLEDPSRRPRFPRFHDAQAVQRILQRTQGLEAVVSSRPIPVISDREDDDVKHEVSMGLTLRGQQVSESLPEPRHLWAGRLDPNWLQKYQPVLEACEVAVYVRRPGRAPNPGTAAELEILQRAGKRVFLFERGD